ncbi:MAG TPA: hypothetical protein V6C58_00800 [Allocoleopsis sp.]
MIKQLNLFPEETQQDPYLHITGDIPLDIPEDCLISVERKNNLKIHSLGFQPGKSIPEIPRWFLHKYAKKNLIILEPFAGSGTTIIESIINNNSIYWLDYHPLSRLICQVKTTKFVISEVLETVLTIIEQSSIEQKPPETIYFPNKDFWFQKALQENLDKNCGKCEKFIITILAFR